jgi:glutamate formiminotransferase/formiminotetrahydrofolate cyclodeaminase
VRGKDGGLSAVKALGFELKDRGIVQVSMNMVDYKSTELFKAFELVKTLAEHHGVQVLDSEIVGLVPLEALTDAAEFYLQLRGFSKNQILETKLLEPQADKLVAMDLVTFGSELASEKPVPGGGSVSAYTGSLAAGLVSMVSRLTLKREEYEKSWSKVEGILTESETLRERLLALVDQDSQSFDSLMQAYRLPKSSEEEKRVRSTEIQRRLKGATEIPLTTGENAAQVLSLSRSLSDCANENALSDLQTATFLAYASVMGALSNVAINLIGIRDEEYQNRIRSRVDLVQKQTEQDKNGAIDMLAYRRKR